MRVFMMLILVMVFSSCVRNKSGVTVENQPAVDGKVFEVNEVIQGSSYTYMKVKENMSERWVAVTKQEIANGEVYYYDNALQMNGFHSKELDRTFDVIYFVNQISKTPVQQSSAGSMGMGGMSGMGGMNMSPHSGKVESNQESEITLEKTESELTVADIFSKREDYSGKETEIRGVVVKVNNNIMGKNWVHIQDGTQSGQDYDLTITTSENVNVNDEVTFKGKITLDKDFGAGYFYDVIMEEAELVSSETTVNL